jgi:hypothetical protein
VSKYVPTLADTQILKKFALYPYLTVDQVTRMLYSKASATYVSTRLSTLAKEFYLYRSKRLSANHPYAYTLGVRGVRLLQSEGIGVSYRPANYMKLSYPFFEHLMEVNEFLIAASFVPSIHPDIELWSLKHDLILRKELPNRPVVPDGWIEFRRIREQQCIWLELDRGTEDTQKDFRRKIADILEYTSDGYEKDFGTPSVTVAFATTAGEKRLHTMLAWTEREVEEASKFEEADLFRFTAIPSGPLDPKFLFFSPLWHVLFQRNPVPLLN